MVEHARGWWREKHPCRKREKHACWEKHTVRSEDDDAGEQKNPCWAQRVHPHMGWRWRRMGLISSSVACFSLASYCFLSLVVVLFSLIIACSLLSEMLPLPHKRSIIHAPAPDFTRIPSKRYSHLSQLCHSPLFAYSSSFSIRHVTMAEVPNTPPTIGINLAIFCVRYKEIMCS